MYGLYIFLTLLWKQNGEIDVQASKNGSQFTILFTAILEKKNYVCGVCGSKFVYIWTREVRD